MIFVTVGTQLPFDRLVKTVDAWVGRNRIEAFGQIGAAEYKPHNMKWSEFLEPSEFDDLFKRSNLIVAHAGMGSILSALSSGKPIIVIPRRADNGEHRNDHQIATALKFSKSGILPVAFDETELLEMLDAFHVQSTSMSPISPYASPELIGRLKAAIAN